MTYKIVIPGKPVGKQRPKAMTISKYYSDEPRVEIMIEEER